MAISTLPTDVTATFEDQGFVVVPNVFDAAGVGRIRAALARAIDQTVADGQALYREGIDPNDRNVRVVTLIGRDPVFAEIVSHPTVLELVGSTMAESYLLSSLSANIALPGSRSMGLHNDMMAVLPQPWLEPYGVNILFYLHDTDEENGATRYLPGSHRFPTADLATQDDVGRTLPIEAPAGSIVAVDGRLWHTSGANTSADRERAVLISFYTADFIRTQYNWHALLSEETKAGFSPTVRKLLALDHGNLSLTHSYDAFKNSKYGNTGPHGS